MSKPINPLAIGSFTVGAVALVIVALFMFGGGQFFKSDKVYFVVFFDSSLNGLNIGAPVKMQGVQIGEVTDIALQFDKTSIKIYKPVVVAIDRSRVIGSSGRAITDEERLALRDRLVKAGFRARLETQSLLTGLLYVDVDKHTNKPPVFAKLEYKGIPEFPGILTTSDEILHSAEEFLNQLRALPLEQIVTDFADNLREMKDLLASDELKQSQVSLAHAMEGMEKAVGTLNRNLEPMLKSTHTAIDNTNLLVQDSRSMVQDIKPILASANNALTAATAALNKAQDSVAMVGDTFGPESALIETLESVNDASRSIKILADYLERHPESLISGKHN
ncbi:MlaD family protein [Methylotuvimicrobium alcaliphilum]|uniref:Mammalian cell entry related domain protein n=1 Tax=Methylotuvimicrobium alcaliphilum (strain DSM 19304 / NCIMB 14124 / VKM B-2133 / 20Z) TaxID=1091494 RepID=G4SZ19_META2|nr:MlaD family protein [Methylotuvimicrobium alcaliphilum]CCE25476.1 putative Mammalian cell entry related domain protein [Methylotuvimicrobium alcaliphilum 20Z]